MQKPHRVVIGHLAGYADEAAAYLRRRRVTRQPFVRLWWSGERGAALDAASEEGRALFLAASHLIDLAAE
jgi:hypothetical protein